MAAQREQWPRLTLRLNFDVVYLIENETSQKTKDHLNHFSVPEQN